MSPAEAKARLMAVLAWPTSHEDELERLSADDLSELRDIRLQWGDGELPEAEYQRAVAILAKCGGCQ